MRNLEAPLWKGLQGKADANKDGTISLDELYEYLKPNAQKIACKQYNNEQTCNCGSPEVLSKWGGVELPQLPRRL